MVSRFIWIYDEERTYNPKFANKIVFWLINSFYGFVLNKHNGDDSSQSHLKEIKKCPETGHILDDMGMCRWQLPTEKKLHEISVRLISQRKL
jgi:hypothetical protein